MSADGNHAHPHQQNNNNCYGSTCQITVGQWVDEAVKTIDNCCQQSLGIEDISTIGIEQGGGEEGQDIKETEALNLGENDINNAAEQCEEELSKDSKSHYDRAQARELRNCNHNMAKDQEQHHVNSHGDTSQCGCNNCLPDKSLAIDVSGNGITNEKTHCKAQEKADREEEGRRKKKRRERERKRDGLCHLGLSVRGRRLRSGGI